MIEVLSYRQISFDSAKTAPGQTLNSTMFFQVPSYSTVDGSARVTEFDEKPIVRWLMLHQPTRRFVFGEFGLPPDAYYQPEVIQPFYSPGEGDLDLVLCPRSAPTQAICLECKRVKIEIVNEGQDRINKLQGIARGVYQANRLYNGPHSFFQTYLVIITEVVASRQNQSNIPMRGVRSHSRPERGDIGRTTFRQLVEFPSRESLDHNIGILFLELVQPSLVSIDTQASVRICIYRRATPPEQRNSVTGRMLELMK